MRRGRESFQVELSTIGSSPVVCVRQLSAARSGRDVAHSSRTTTNRLTIQIAVLKAYESLSRYDARVEAALYCTVCTVCTLVLYTCTALDCTAPAPGVRRTAA
eukprot:3709842-Pyramimonas_sp.AAC.1